MSFPCPVAGCGFSMASEADLADHMEVMKTRHDSLTGMTQPTKMTVDPELSELRSIGVKRFRRGDFEVEFFPQEPKDDGPLVPPSFTQNAPHEEEKCSCDHILPAHNADGLCLLGCDVAKCARTMTELKP